MRIAPLISAKITQPIVNRGVSPVNFNALQRAGGCDVVSFGNGADEKKRELPLFFQKSENEALRNYEPSKEELAYYDVLQDLVALDNGKSDKSFEDLKKAFNSAYTNIEITKNKKPVEDRIAYTLAILIEANDNTKPKGEIGIYLHNELRTDYAWAFVKDGFLDETLNFYGNNYPLKDPMISNRLATFAADWR